MICKSCRDQDHDQCQGQTWCDCQHKVSGGPWTTASGKVFTEDDAARLAEEAERTDYPLNPDQPSNQ